MSNHLAIATVTETLRQLLAEAVADDVSGAEVRAIAPGAASSGEGGPTTPVVSIYLYQVSPNPALRNQDLPSRRANGTLAQRPAAALDLSYLLTFHGNENELEPQRALGSAVRVLHSRPVLTREMIEKVVAVTPYLAGSNLAGEVDLVKLAPLSLSLEELSKLWSALLQTPYALSLVYQASVVLIEAEEVGRRALPVRERGFYVRPFGLPSIDRVTSEPTEHEPLWSGGPILPGHLLVITGRQLRGEPTLVRLGGAGAEPASVGDTRITVRLGAPPLQPDALRAGIQAVQVIHPVPMGEPPEARAGFESNLAAFVLRPVFRSEDVEVVDTQEDDTPVRNLKITLQPKVAKGQRAVLLLNRLSASPEKPDGYRFSALMGEDGTDTVSFLISDKEGDCVVPSGDYLVRVQIDGAESPLAVDQAGAYIEPKVNIP